MGIPQRKYILDDFLRISRKDILTHAGKISAKLAKEKADTEYDKFKERTKNDLSPVEIHFLENFERERKRLSDDWEKLHSCQESGDKHGTVPLLHHCRFWSRRPMTLDYSEPDSFVILIGLKGEAKITDNEGNEITLQGGESIVVPATPRH